VISNDIFCNCLRMSGRTGVIASEEEATPVAVEETDSGNYIVVFDPLDGSSNIDAGAGGCVSFSLGCSELVKWVC
jgi:fructose-1,6-bisphosphatase I